MRGPDAARTTISLNGRWHIAPGLKDTPPAVWTHDVPVPGLVDLAMPGYDWTAHKYHWYRRTFSLPSDHRGRRVFLKIDQAMFGTAIWVNGRSVGQDIACYTSQEYDLTGAVESSNDNEIMIRVGVKNTLPPESAVGRDQERTEFIPGIWGDVNLVLCGGQRISLAQVIPHIDRQSAEVFLTIENKAESAATLSVNAEIVERSTQRVSSPMTSRTTELDGRSTGVVRLEMLLDGMRLWSVDDPFLYELRASLSVGEEMTDATQTTFGMREFRIAGHDFLLNGQRIYLRGGNIAFHRFLSDADRGTLPWNSDWIKKVLIDIPKEHHFNFFRNHLGQMYSRWYDLADEYGMLLQNEWQFWLTTGTKEQITNEFTRWLQDNWNHPSIILWDALNECSDEIVQREIVPEMKKLDPTRPWESVDFIEQHPYIYSLGPVLNEKKLGFAVSMGEMQDMPSPSVVNEFLWWWLDNEWKPTILMKDVIERWLGRDYTLDDVINRQSFLAQELVELFRRMRVDAIQPFVYISNNAGPTAHWFLGNIRDVQPKPILQTLRNAFSPFGISIELWDRHFLPGETRKVRLFVFNDDPLPRMGTVRYGVVRFDGKWTFESSLKVDVGPADCSVSPVQIMLPRQPGEYRIRAELLSEGLHQTVSCSEKIAHVFDPQKEVAEALLPGLLVLERSDEVSRFLTSGKNHVAAISAENLHSASVVIVGEGMLGSEAFAGVFRDLTRFVRSGRTLILIEPEYGVEGKETIPVLDGLSLEVERRIDADKGGYDSYVFAEDAAHPLWAGIKKQHLHMFNGGLGGEVVSQHSVNCQAEHLVHARCGLNLNVEAVFEVPFGRGRVLVSRLQLRGRLVRNNGVDSLFARRTDPVLQRHLFNLIRYAGESVVLD